MKNFLILKILGTTWYSVSLFWFLSNWIKEIGQMWNGVLQSNDHPLSVVSLAITLFWTSLRIGVISLLLKNFEKGIISLALVSILISLIFLSLYKSIVADPIQYAPIIFMIIAYSALGVFALYVQDVRAKELGRRG